MSPEQRLPDGWDEKRIRRVATHYEQQSEDDSVAEDEAAVDEVDSVMMEIPAELVPEVRRLIARHDT